MSEFIKTIKQVVSTEADSANTPVSEIENAHSKEAHQENVKSEHCNYANDYYGDQKCIENK